MTWPFDTNFTHWHDEYIFSPARVVWFWLFVGTWLAVGPLITSIGPVVEAEWVRYLYLLPAVCGELASDVWRKSRELSAKSKLKLHHLMLGFMYMSSFARGHDMPLSRYTGNYFSTLLPSIDRSNGRTRPYSMEHHGLLMRGWFWKANRYGTTQHTCPPHVASYPPSSLKLVQECRYAVLRTKKARNTVNRPNSCVAPNLDAKSVSPLYPCTTWFDPNSLHAEAIMMHLGKQPNYSTTN
jgi:hypothetical protein